MEVKDKAKEKKKCLVLFSGGLDSRLALILMKKLGFETIALNFVLPFLTSSQKITLNFAKDQKVRLIFVDCTKGKLFDEYLKIVKKPRYGYGNAMNPCIDCKIFMLKKAKEIMKKIKADFIVTGDVLNERPMSQTAKALKLIEKEAGLEGFVLRPLSAKLLAPTIVEKQGIVKREMLLAIKGRGRKKQIELAKKYGISFPSPAGGCLLCEKEYASKLKDLFRHKKRIKPIDIALLKIGRHFRYKKAKIMVGRNKKENEKLRELAKDLFLFEARNVPSPLTVLDGKINKETIKIAAALTAFYSDARDKEVEVVYGKGKFNRKVNKVIKISKPSKEAVEKLRIRW